MGFGLPLLHFPEQKILTIRLSASKAVLLQNNIFCTVIIDPSDESKRI